jgi:hypothetical protein
MKKRFRDYPPNVPRKLIKAFRAVGCNTRKLEKEIGVNNYYICKLLNDGIEPSNPTIREKMFFEPPKVPKPRSPYSVMPRWWERTPEALRQFQHIRDQARIIANETREQQFAYKKKKRSSQ